jgi:hypothetical protein
MLAEVKKSIIYKLFPTITQVDDDVTLEDLNEFSKSGFRSRATLMDDIENIIWTYEDDIEGLTRRDFKGALDVYELSEIFDNETICLTVQAKKGTGLYKRLPSFFWEVDINLRTGEGEVSFAGD